MKALASIFILTLSMLGLSACQSDTQAQPNTVAVERTVEAATPLTTCTEEMPCWDADLEVEHEAAPASALTWDQEVLATTDIELPANVVILYTSETNCGAQLSTMGLGGCTYHTPSQEVITISPELKYTESGVHILLHEIGHALGIDEECGAEEFAHQWSNPTLWSYPECAPTAAPEITTAAPVVAAQPTAVVQQPVTPAATTVATQQPIAPITAATQQPTNEPQPPAPTVPSIPALTDTPDVSVYPEPNPETEPVPVPEDVWTPRLPNEPSNPMPVDCNNLQLGDAHAGIGLVCGLDPAQPNS